MYAWPVDSDNTGRVTNSHWQACMHAYYCGTCFIWLKTKRLKCPLHPNQCYTNWLSATRPSVGARSYKVSKGSWSGDPRSQRQVRWKKLRQKEIESWGLSGGRLVKPSSHTAQSLFQNLYIYIYKSRIKYGTDGQSVSSYQTIPVLERAASSPACARCSEAASLSILMFLRFVVSSTQSTR